jgi:hypothetical protein
MIYARHASPEFNKRLDAALRAIVEDLKAVLGRNLLAVVLGGGYGRGEGGVVRRGDRECPYNDVDLCLVVRWKLPFPQASLQRVAERHHAALGVEIDLGRPQTIGGIRRWPPWLRWFDLVHGHIVLHGDSRVIAGNAPSTVAEGILPIEAMRLLLNRGAGLVWAHRVVRGCEPPPDPDFVRRNYYKCAQALADGILIAHGRYSPQTSERLDRFAALAEGNEGVAELGLQDAYARSLAFKLRPDQAPPIEPAEKALEAMGGLWGRVVLHVEGLRTGRGWRSLDEYVAWRGPREADQNRPSRWVRNWVRNLQVGIWSLRYLRERLYRELPCLLELTDARMEDWTKASRRFLDIWSRCG